jgi:hypothetical protein
MSKASTRFAAPMFFPKGDSVHGDMRDYIHRFVNLTKSPLLVAGRQRILRQGLLCRIQQVKNLFEHPPSALTQT